MEKLSKNFSIFELICPCGACEPIIDEAFVEKLQKLRDAFKNPMPVNSWYRCPEHNAKVGGASGSKHLEGIAVDIMCTNSRLRYDLVQLAQAFDFRGVGIYSRWIHIDDRDGPPTMWVG